LDFGSLRKDDATMMVVVVGDENVKPERCAITPQQDCERNDESTNA
jgi:hypothetical protein